MFRRPASSAACGTACACGSSDGGACREGDPMTDVQPIVHLNGQFLPLAEAKISVLDRGFIFGDGVYEVVPVYARTPFRMPHHLARLQHSMDGIGLTNPHTPAQWERLIAELVALQPFADQSVYLQVT